MGAERSGGVAESPAGEWQSYKTRRKAAVRSEVSGIASDLESVLESQERRRREAEERYLFGGLGGDDRHHPHPHHHHHHRIPTDPDVAHPGHRGLRSVPHGGSPGAPRVYRSSPVMDSIVAEQRGSRSRSRGRRSGSLLSDHGLGAEFETLAEAKEADHRLRETRRLSRELHHTYGGPEDVDDSPRGSRSLFDDDDDFLRRMRERARVEDSRRGGGGGARGRSRSPSFGPNAPPGAEGFDDRVRRGEGDVDAAFVAPPLPVEPGPWGRYRLAYRAKLEMEASGIVPRSREYGYLSTTGTGVGHAATDTSAAVAARERAFVPPNPPRSELAKRSIENDVRRLAPGEVGRGPSPHRNGADPAVAAAVSNLPRVEPLIGGGSNQQGKHSTYEDELYEREKEARERRILERQRNGGVDEIATAANASERRDVVRSAAAEVRPEVVRKKGLVGKFGRVHDHASCPCAKCVRKRSAPNPLDRPRNTNAGATEATGKASLRAHPGARDGPPGSSSSASFAGAGAGATNSNPALAGGGAGGVNDRGLGDAGGPAAVVRARGAAYGSAPSAAGGVFGGRSSEEIERERNLERGPPVTRACMNGVATDRKRLRSLALSGQLSWSGQETVAGVETMSRQFDKEDSLCYRGRCIVELPADRVFHFLSRLEYDPQLLMGEVVQRIDRSHEVIHIALDSGSSLAADRDFVVFESAHEGEDGSYLIAYRSIEHPDRPPGSYTRGEIRFAGYVIVPAASNRMHSVVIAVMQMNAGGWMPGTIGDSMSKAFVEKLSVAKRIMEKNPERAPPLSKSGQRGLRPAVFQTRRESA